MRCPHCNAVIDLSPPALPLRADVVAAVAYAYGLSVDEILAPSRERRVAWPRQEAMWRLRQQRLADGRQRFSYPSLARFFGVHHTTIIHGVRAYEQRSGIST